MKLTINNKNGWLILPALMMCCLMFMFNSLRAQDSTATEEVQAPVKPKPVKNTFQSIWLSDNQTVLVPIKGTMEMDIQHRFGTWNNGYQDFWGLFAPSNIRIGIGYVPINKLMIGIGFTKTTAAVIPKATISTVSGPLWDGSLKYSIITQTKGRYPVSVTYYGNASYNTKKDPNHDIYRYYSDRIAYFNEIIIARKITNKLSVQLAPNLSHHNVVNGYFTKLNDSTLKVNQSMR